jgi:hypothetical protein
MYKPTDHSSERNVWRTHHIFCITFAAFALQISVTNVHYQEKVILKVSRIF